LLDWYYICLFICRKTEPTSANFIYIKEIIFKPIVMDTLSWSITHSCQHHEYSFALWCTMWSFSNIIMKIQALQTCGIDTLVWIGNISHIDSYWYRVLPFKLFLYTWLNMPYWWSKAWSGRNDKARIDVDVISSIFHIAGVRW
jgi:predicted small integral membrane protein